MSREEIVNNIGYQLTRAAVDYIEKHEFADGMDCFEAGAEWMQERMIEKAVEWLKEEMYYKDQSSGRGCWGKIETLGTYDSLEEFIDEFKQAMQDESRRLD